MDHLIPLVRGGRSEKFNLVPCCKDCNSKNSRCCPGNGMCIWIDWSPDHKKGIETHGAGVDAFVTQPNGFYFLLHRR